MRRMSGIGAMLAALLGPGAAAAAAVDAEGYREGQVWDYRTRPGDEGSLLRIGRIEPSPAGVDGDRIYHISIAGVRLAPEGAPTILEHLPVAKETLDASVTRRTDRTADFGDMDEGIAEWRRARGGVFKIPVADLIETIAQTLVTGTAQPSE